MTTTAQNLSELQWLPNRRPLALEMLVTAVMPNHPAVNALVAEAAQVLHNTSGDCRERDHGAPGRG